MSRVPHEEFLKVSWVPSIANTAAPTVAELDAGTSLECWLTPDGLMTQNTTASVDVSSPCSADDLAVAGSRSFDNGIRAYRDNGTDTVWNLVNWGDAGHLVVRRLIPVGTAWTAGQKVEVYPGTWGNPTPVNSARNEAQKVEAKLFTSGPTKLKATVAA